MTFRLKVQGKRLFLYNDTLFNSGITPPNAQAMSSTVQAIHQHIKLTLL